MIKNEITDLQLDYFSFSMKLRVGEFLESKEVKLLFYVHVFLSIQ